jgi:uracil-DNA glycosylase family 4
MESNKKSSEFNFYEAALVKRTPLFRDCTNIVVGDGDLSADIMFVGEAPGRNEDLQGVPFCGAAGKNLDKLLENVGLKREDIYIANILKCRPPENRDPLPEEIEAHTPWLLKQIKEIRPKVVCSLGNYSTKFFLAKGNVDEMKKMPGISLVHGEAREITFRGATGNGQQAEGEDITFTLIPLFHPAAIIYNRTKLTPLWEEDMGIVRNFISNNQLVVGSE